MDSTTIRSEPYSNAEGFDLDKIQDKDRRKLLVVDDEPDTVVLLKHILRHEGYDVAGASNGVEALARLNEIQPSLILLDMMMPQMDGWQTIDKIREVTSTPIIILSANSQVDSIIHALQVGADDYITKPFNHAEVVARIEAVMRRSRTNGKIDRLGFDQLDLILDTETHEVIFQNQHIQLTDKMYDVFYLLMENAPRLVTYQELAEKVWGQDNVSIRNRLKYLVYLLRQEFTRIDPNANIIDNIGRLGYKLITK